MLVADKVYNTVQSLHQSGPVFWLKRWLQEVVWFARRAQEPVVRESNTRP